MSERAPMLCALCLCNDERREGADAFGGGVPLCAEHAAACRERAAKPAPPRIIRSPTYEDACARSALAGAPSPLADIARPAGATLQ